MKNSNKFLFKIKFRNRMFKTIAVSEKEALSHIGYSLLKPQQTKESFDTILKELEIIERTFHSYGEYKQNNKRDFRKINSLYKELYLEEARKLELNYLGE